jgi:AcrR family transcriptional regulator
MSQAAHAYQETRAGEILDAAMDVFARQGIEAATMAEVARAADLSAGAIYRYYPSKEELVRAVFAQCELHSTELFAQARAEADGSPLAAIVALGRVGWGQFQEEHARAHALISVELALAGARDPSRVTGVERPAARVLQELEELVRAAKAAGELGADVAPAALAQTLIAIFLGVQFMTIESPDAVDPEGVRSAMNQMLGALASRERARV